jgi:hypothetical protein
MIEPTNSTRTSASADDALVATQVGDAGEDETLYQSGVHSLEAATRLVEPMRLNNLTPEEILPRHLRRAIREVRRARRAFGGIQRDANWVLHTARREAQRGQRMARMAPSRRRSRQVQHALRRADSLNTFFAAIEEERSRYARKVAAARDLLYAWEHDKRGLKRRPGGFFARLLRQATLAMGRVERVTRERLDEARRALVHVAVAEEAMRRDADMVRMDPVNFRRFAGRGRLGVRLGMVAVVLALVALIYPPWAPPRLSLGCTFPTRTHNACAAVHATSELRIINQGDGLLVGWATITVNQDGASTSQVLPFVLLPRGTHNLLCGDYSGCILQPGSSIHVQITTSGGISPTVNVVP